MEIREADHIEFGKVFDKPNHVFNHSSFNNLNKDKADLVNYLIFSNEGKPKLGITGGIKTEKFYSPFSAPFGGWCYNEKPDIKDIEGAYDALESWCPQKGIKSIRIVPPPLFYDESSLSMFFSTAIRKNYTLEIVDLNFHFKLANFNSDYLENIAYNARKNYNVGERKHLIVEKVTDIGSIQLAYNIIAQNRQQRGYPLKMSLNNIEETIKIINADFFITYTSDRVAIASAMVFRVTDKIAQVVYWGHNIDYSSLKPINYLSYNLFEYYKEAKLEHLDIGPSTELGIPNYGLIEFKQSIGCSISSKLTFEKKL